MHVHVCVHLFKLQCHEYLRIITFFLPEHTIKLETITTHLNYYLSHLQYFLYHPSLNLSEQTVAKLFDITTELEYDF